MSNVQWGKQSAASRSLGIGHWSLVIEHWVQFSYGGILMTETPKRGVTVTFLDQTGAKSVRNLPGVHLLSPDQLNTYDVLHADDVVFSVEALNAWISANTKTQEVSA